MKRKAFNTAEARRLGVATVGRRLARARRNARLVRAALSSFTEEDMDGNDQEMVDALREVCMDIVEDLHWSELAGRKERFAPTDDQRNEIAEQQAGGAR